MPSTGDRIGRYLVRERLGAGGMGEVWRATDVELGRDVALKLLPPAFTQDPSRRERMLREARFAASFSHPHVATVLEFLEHEGTLVLGM